MGKYGIPYKGSKSKIAEDILEQLPPGKRLVDLFGGGFAITDCALRKFSDKWERFYYNDHNPLLQPLIMDAIHGKYSENNFHPVWISREEFNKMKNTDGYIKWIWSFGNNGNDYLYGRNSEEQKHKAFEFIVNGEESDITSGIELTGKTIHDRRIEWMHKVKNSNINVNRLQSLERLQCLSQLESLARLESLTRLEPLARLDYRQYEYKPGDIVYCDIPYEDSANPKDYGGGFNHKEFFEWANSRPYTIYYSSYTKGAVMWQKEVRSVMNASSGAVRRMETLFAI
jgi:site-specific DNA-adenine methylase